MPDSSQKTGDLVRELIERDGVIKNGLARGLINSRALARYFQVMLHERVTFEALLGAIRRYPVGKDEVKRELVGRLVSKLSLKNRIAVIEVLNAPEIPEAIATFSTSVDYARGDTFSVVSGNRRTRIAVDSKNVDKLVKLIPKRNLLGITRNLAEVVLEMDEKTINIPGVYATITTELAMNDINIVDPLSCIPEIIFIVAQEDGAKSYEVLERLIKE